MEGNDAYDTVDGAILSKTTVQRTILLNRPQAVKFRSNDIRFEYLQLVMLKIGVHNHLFWY
jgi:hypothetical protein